MTDPQEIIRDHHRVEWRSHRGVFACIIDGQETPCDAVELARTLLEAQGMMRFWAEAWEVHGDDPAWAERARGAMARQFRAFLGEPEATHPDPDFASLSPLDQRTADGDR